MSILILKLLFSTHKKKKKKKKRKQNKQIKYSGGVWQCMGRKIKLYFCGWDETKYIYIYILNITANQIFSFFKMYFLNIFYQILYFLKRPNFNSYLLRLLLFFFFQKTIYQKTEPNSSSSNFVQLVLWQLLNLIKI